MREIYIHRCDKDPADHNSFGTIIDALFARPLGALRHAYSLYFYDRSLAQYPHKRTFKSIWEKRR